MILFFFIIFAFFGHSVALSLNVKHVRSGVEIGTQGYFFKEFEILGEYDNISYNCSSSVMIYFGVVSCDTKTLPATGFLNHHGDVSKDPSDVKDCRRTKLFSLNSSHVLLRFGQINHIVDRKGINALISLLLWEYDPTHWALYKVYFYNELKFCYEWNNLIFQVLAIPCVATFSKFLYELLFIMYYFCYYLKHLSENLSELSHEIRMKFMNFKELQDEKTKNSWKCDIKEECTNCKGCFVNLARHSKYCKAKK